MSSLTILALHAVSGLLAGAPSPSVDPLIDKNFSQQPQQRVLVQVEDPLARTSLRGRSEAADTRSARIDARRTDLAARKARVLKHLQLTEGISLEMVFAYPAFRLFAVDVDPAALSALATAPEVTAIFADTIHPPLLESSLPHAHVLEFQENRSRGEGVAVAILDSPVRYSGGHFGTCNQPGSIGCSLKAQHNFTAQSIQTVQSYEDRLGRSHGTNVAAIAHGVAPGAGVFGLNVFQGLRNGSLGASTSDVIAALNWVAFNAAAQNIVAANMSLGSERTLPGACNQDSYAGPIRTLYMDHDVLTVVASGNDATQNAVGSPACINLAVTVAAHYDNETARYSGYDCFQEAPRDQEMACFSNLNGLVDLVAPGVFVDAGGYKLSGTSMAAPHVTGAVALRQGYFVSTEGRTQSAHLTHQALMLGSGRIVHIDGRIFARLDMASEAAWDRAEVFGLFAEEGSDNQFDGQGAQWTLNIADADYQLSGAYLFLELNHDAPATLEVTLEGPGGHRAEINLPGLQANFTGVIGRQYDLQALAGFTGQAASGDWTLSISAPQGAGHLMNATLLLRQAECVPECTDAGCGDDGCGGRCEGGHCTINQRCYADGRVPRDNACLICDATASPSAWGRSGAGCQIDGQCYSPGAAYQTVPCMSCRPDVSTRGWSPNDGFCVVAGTCLQAGDRRPNSPCRGCAPDQDTRSYSSLTDISCDDEDACTQEDSCQEGRCEGEPVVCPMPGPCQERISCAASSGDCVTAPKADGTVCEASGICAAGLCQLPEAKDEGCSCRAGHGLDGVGFGWVLLLSGLALRRRSRR